ncbi:MAG: hypothetical protein HDR05_03200 [Lachnospiraceae bacterium]|nr:hypothetical protein [Lachnospiraceae bacterium]
MDPTTEGEAENVSDSTLNAMDAKAALPAPTITVTRGEAEQKSGVKVPYGTSDIKFTLKGEPGNDLYYVAGKEPVTTAAAVKEGKKITSEEPVEAPTDTAETTMTIQAIQVTPAVTADPDNGIEAADEVLSEIAEFKIVFEAKVNRIKVDSNVANAEVMAGTAANTIKTKLDADGYALDETKDLFLTATVIGEDAATKEVKELQYVAQPESGTITWSGDTPTPGIKTAEALTGANKGKFKIPKEDLTKDLVLNVVTGDMPKIKIELGSGTNTKMFTVTAKVAGKTVLNNVNLQGNATDDIYAPTGSKVEITITNAASCTLETVTVQAGTDDAKPNTISNKKTSKVTINAIDKDQTITVTAAESYKNAVIKKNNEEQKETKAKTWTVAPRETYEISAVQGGGSAFMLTDVSTVSGNGLEIEPLYDGSGDEKTPNGKFSLKVGEAANGKTHKLTLYGGEGEDKKKVDEISIIVTPVITSVTVTGVKNGVLSQVIGTNGKYAITPKEKNSSDTLVLGALSAEASNHISATLSDDCKYLIIDTKSVAPAAEIAEIKIYNAADADNTATATPVETFKVTTTAPTWAEVAGKGGVAPTVKQSGATDVQLNLDMTLPKGASVLTTEADAEYYYKVTTKSVETLSANGFSAFDDNKARYIKASTDNATTAEPIQVIDGTFGKGTSAKFNVEVVLELYTKGATAGTDTPIVSSKAALLKNAATKAPYYADKITLKKEKAASGVYTGQTIAVATVDFGKDTTYNRDGDVKAWVVGNENNTKQGPADIYVKEFDGLTVKDSKVTLVVGKDVTPGKIKIKVEQTSGTGIPAGAVSASATLDVTVVQGIKDITASSQSTIYVQAGKAASAKIATVYNDGTAATKPKTAKVGYTVGKVTIEKDDDNNDVKKFVAGDITGVSVKNGTVSITKDFDAETNKAFAVKVYADDYHNAGEDETRYALVEYKIETDKQELGEIVLVTKNGTAYTPVAAVTDAKGKEVLSITADKAADTTVRILPKNAAKKDSYTVDEFVPDDLYALTFSKKNDIELKNDALNVKKTVDKVKVTALTTDGGKQKADNTLEFSVTYEVVKAKLQINGANFDEGNTKTVNSTTSTIVNIKAVDETDKDFTGRLVDYKITAGKGAKIVSGAGTLEVGVQLTAAEATLNLTDMKGKGAVPYTIKNTNFALNKAPKVSVAKGEKLRAGDKNNIDQPLKFTVAKLSKEDQINAVKVSVGTDKDSQELGKKLLSTGYVEVTDLSKNSNGTFTLDFGSDLPVIKKATLYFDFYYQEENPDYTDDNGQEKLITTLKTQTSTAVTVKTETLKKAYKLTNKYTMSQKDKGSVTLSASKPSGVKDQATQVEFKEILNANIKGTVNSFAVKNKDGNYTEDGAFGLVGNKLVLLNPEKASKAYGENKQAKIKGINNLIGFVKYTVTYDDKTAEDFITQITVNMLASDKVAVKPTAAKASILNAVNETTTITVKAGKDDVELVYAELEGAGNLFKMTALSTTEKNNGTVTLTLTKAAEKAGTQKGTLKVVLADSFYAPTVKKGEGSTDDDKAAYEKALASAVIEVPVTIDVKALNTKNKVKVNDTKPSFKDKVAEKVDGKDVYKLEVSYTPVVAASVSKIEADRSLKSNKPLTPAWVSFDKGAGNTMVITIDKAAYASYVKAEEKTTSKGKSYPLNGKAVDATAVFTYSADGAVADSVKLKITPPTLTAEEIGAAVVEKEITVTVTPAAPEVAKGDSQEFTAEVIVDGKKQDNPTVAWSVAAVDEGVTKAADTKFGDNADANKLTVASDETATKLTVTATYTDDGKTYTGTATVTVK